MYKNKMFCNSLSMRHMAWTILILTMNHAVDLTKFQLHIWNAQRTIIFMPWVKMWHWKVSEKWGCNRMKVNWNSCEKLTFTWSCSALLWQRSSMILEQYVTCCNSLLRLQTLQSLSRSTSKRILQPCPFSPRQSRIVEGTNITKQDQPIIEDTSLIEVADSGTEVVAGNFFIITREIIMNLLPLVI